MAGDHHPQPTDPTRGHGLVTRLLTLHPPKDAETGDRLDAIRGNFIELGHTIVALTPEGPDQTIAIRKLHEACQAAIATVVCNQDTAPAEG